jgi:hypothetical protein
MGLEFLLLLFRQLDYSPLMGLMMMEFDPGRVTLPNQEWFIGKKESTCAYLMPDFLS